MWLSLSLPNAVGSRVSPPWCEAVAFEAVRARFRCALEHRTARAPRRVRIRLFSSLSRTAPERLSGEPACDLCGVVCCDAPFSPQVSPEPIGFAPTAVPELCVTPAAHGAASTPCTRPASVLVRAAPCACVPNVPTFDQKPSFPAASELRICSGIHRSASCDQRKQKIAYSNSDRNLTPEHISYLRPQQPAAALNSDSRLLPTFLTRSSFAPDAGTSVWRVGARGVAVRGRTASGGAGYRRAACRWVPRLRTKNRRKMASGKDPLGFAGWFRGPQSMRAQILGAHGSYRILDLLSGVCLKC